jgi:hypothetical protein
VKMRCLVYLAATFGGGDGTTFVEDSHLSCSAAVALR